SRAASPGLRFLHLRHRAGERLERSDPGLERLLAAPAAQEVAQVVDRAVAQDRVVGGLGDLAPELDRDRLVARALARPGGEPLTVLRRTGPERLPRRGR